MCCCCLVTKSCPTFYNSMDGSPPGSFVHDISQARILQWVAISFSRRFSWPRDKTHISCLAGGFFTTEPPGKPQFNVSSTNLLIVHLWAVLQHAPFPSSHLQLRAPPFCPHLLLWSLTLIVFSLLTSNSERNPVGRIVKINAKLNHHCHFHCYFFGQTMLISEMYYSETQFTYYDIDTLQQMVLGKLENCNPSLIQCC